MGRVIKHVKDKRQGSLKYFVCAVEICTCASCALHTFDIKYIFDVPRPLLSVNCPH